MAKMFMNAEEAAKRLGVGEDQLKAYVREGKLREFRDAGAVNYKVADVEKLAGSGAKPAIKAPPAGSGVARSTGAAAGGSASGEILLEPVEDSSIELAPSGTDVLTLEGADAVDIALGTSRLKKAKEGSSVPSVGINVFDDDEIDEHVDPLAQTAVSDVAGLGIDAVGSGSGILDLTRESDDTSLGAELLEEIYTGEEGGEAKAGSSAAVMGEATRAGLDAALPEAAAEEEEDVFQAEAATAERKMAGAKVRQVVEYGPDPVSTALTALLVVGVVVMGFGGLAVAALVQGTVPGILQTLYSNLMIFAGAAVVVAGLAAGVTFFIAKRSA
jgi:hypothetical protein